MHYYINNNWILIEIILIYFYVIDIFYHLVVAPKSFFDELPISVVFFLFNTFDSGLAVFYFSRPRAALAFCSMPLFFALGVASVGLAIWVGGRMPDFMLLRAEY